MKKNNLLHWLRIKAMLVWIWEEDTQLIHRIWRYVLYISYEYISVAFNCFIYVYPNPCIVELGFRIRRWHIRLMHQNMYVAFTIGMLWICICLLVFFRVNVSVGVKEDRLMMTGMHTVADIFCVGCGSIVGWKYVRFVDTLQNTISICSWYVVIGDWWCYFTGNCSWKEPEIQGRKISTRTVSLCNSCDVNFWSNAVI